MRLSSLLLATATAGLLGVAAAAQEAAPPAAPPAKAEPTTGLSGLQDTVSQLNDEPQPAEQPAEPPANAPSTQEEPAPPPATPPEAEAPAPAPATDTPAQTQAVQEEAPPAPAPQPPVPTLTGPALPLSRAEIAQLEANVARGRLIASIAGAGQIATQDMLVRVPDPTGAGISGWIAMPEGNGTTVTFYAEGADGAAPAAIYRGSVLGGRVVSHQVFPAGSRPSLGPIEARMAGARRATDGLDHQPCGGQDFNVFVVPPTTPSGPIDVYQFSAQTQRGHYPLGGHYKTTIASDSTVSASHGLAAVCADTVVADTPEGQPAPPIRIAPISDSLPNEVHVFLTMWTGHPLIVTAGDPARNFAVGSDRIVEMPR